MGKLNGYRTYVLAVVAVVTGVAGYLLGDMSAMEAMNYVWAGGVAAALRAGVESVK